MRTYSSLIDLKLTEIAHPNKKLREGHSHKIKRKMNRNILNQRWINKNYRRESQDHFAIFQLKSLFSLLISELNKEVLSRDSKEIMILRVTTKRDSKLDQCHTLVLYLHSCLSLVLNPWQLNKNLSLE
jgi:hypothetical protein